VQRDKLIIITGDGSSNETNYHQRQHPSSSKSQELKVTVLMTLQLLMLQLLMHLWKDLSKNSFWQTRCSSDTQPTVSKQGGQKLWQNFNHFL